MPFTLQLYTSAPPLEDVPSGAEDPQDPTVGRVSFVDRSEVLVYLMATCLMEPSTWPATDQEPHVWFRGRPGSSDRDAQQAVRYEITAHRDDDISDDDWSAIVRDIAAIPQGNGYLYCYATGRRDLPIALGRHTGAEIRGSLALFADPLTASVAAVAVAEASFLDLHILPSAQALGVTSDPDLPPF